MTLFVRHHAKNGHVYQVETTGPVEEVGDRLTRFPLGDDEAQTHAESLNQNDRDDMRQHGELRN